MRILAPLRGVTVRCFRETFALELAAAGFTEAITPFVTATAGYDPLSDRELKPVDAASRPSVDAASRPSVDAAFRPSVDAASRPSVDAASRRVREERSSAVQPPTSNLQPALPVTPQFIGKDPEALRFCLRRVKSAGYGTADLNCGCPFPMVRNKGRGSGILRTPDVLRRMLDVGCDEMGPGKFSVKARLGVKDPDELLGLMPILNDYPLRFLTVHARTAVQMYEGTCDWNAFRRIEAIAKMPVVANGDLPVDAKSVRVLVDAKSVRVPVDAGFCPRQNEDESVLIGRGLGPASTGVMVGRAFVRSLGAGEASRERLARYLAASERELSGPGAVLGRMKELLTYWKDLPDWHRRWPVVKIARSLDEFRLAAGLAL